MQSNATNFSSPRSVILLIIFVLLSSPIQVRSDALRDATLVDEESHPEQPPSGRSRPLIQLDTVSFELIANAYDFQTNTYTVLQERYSSQQKRGRVIMTTKSTSPTGKKMEQTQVYLVDSELNSSVMRNGLTNSCQPTDWNSVLAHLGFDLIEFESNVSGHLFGAARLLRYFTVHRSQLRVDISDKHYFTKNSLPSLRYERRFIRERERSELDGANSEPIVLEVSVFYTKASLAGAAEWTHALPTRIQYEYPREQRKGLLLEFGPLKFIEADDLGASSDQLDVLMDGLAMEPATGCSEAITKRHRLPWLGLRDDVWRRADSFSFRAKGCHMVTRLASYPSSHFQARVAYDTRLNKLRVDMQSDALDKTIQIIDFTLDKATHILSLPDRSSFLSEMLNEKSEFGAKSCPGSNVSIIQADEQTQPRGAQGDLSKPVLKCVNGEINSTPLTTPMMMTLDNLLIGGSENYAYLGLARVRGIRARVFEAVNTQLPFWLDPQIHTAASKYRFRSPAEQRLITTVIYWSEPSPEEAETRLLLMEIFEMDKELNSTLSKHEISVFDFAWNLRSVGSSEQSGGQQAVSLFSLLDLCSEWRGNDQEDTESHARFRMILRSDKQMASEIINRLRNNPNALQLSLLNTIQLDLHLVLGLIYDFEARFVMADRKDAANHSETLALMVQFNVGRLPRRLNKMMFLGLGRRVANKSWFIRVNSLQECFMLASHRQVEIEFAYDATYCFCYIATQPRRSTATLDPKDLGPFQMDTRATMKVFKTLKIPDYHKSTREWWLSEPELSSRRRRGLVLDLGGSKDELIKMHIDHIRVTQHEPHLLYDASHLVERASVFLGVGLQHQEDLNWLANMEPHRGRNSIEQRLTLGQCQSLCEADFDCRSYSFCLRGIETECVLSRANLNNAKLLSEIRLFLLNKTVMSRRFKLAPDRSVSLMKNRNCATYNKKYLEYYDEVSDSPLEQVLFQRVQPADEPEQCAEICFGQLLSSHHNKAMNKFGHQSDYDILAQRTGRSELDDDDAEGCSKFYFVNVASQDSEDLQNSFELPAESRVLLGLCLTTASISSPGLKLRMAKLQDPDKVISYNFKFSQLYDEQYQVSLKRSPLSELESAAIQTVIGAGLERESPDVESYNIVKQLLERGENLQMMTFVDKEVCARFCYTQSAGLWPYCSSFDVIVSHHADVGPRIRCVLNSSSKWRLLDKGREDLIDSSFWVGENSTEERWHYEIKDGFVGQRQVRWLKSDAELEGEGSDQIKTLAQNGISSKIRRAFGLFVAMSVGVFIGIILMELFGNMNVPRRSHDDSEMRLVKP